MIQVNLLPDVKATYVKAQRTKRTVITLSIIISSVAIGIVVLLASVAFGAQQLTLNNVQNDIDNAVSDIQGVEDLDKILTVQNQLISLEGLHDGKPVAFRVFEYIQKTTPQDVRIDTYSVDYLTNTMTIEGNAPNLEIINQYVDTLKFTQIKSDTELAEGEEAPRAFNNVVLASFATNEEETTYSITLEFEPTLFDSANPSIDIAVPKITTTRSELERPGQLFKQNEAQNQEGNE